jgi:hypothetical protein
MPFALRAATLRQIDGRNYAVLATVNPDGSPQTAVVARGRADGGREGRRLRGVVPQAAGGAAPARPRTKFGPLLCSF